MDFDANSCFLFYPHVYSHCCFFRLGGHFMISLKTFHLFFIMMSIILTVWFAIYELQLDQNGTATTLAIVSLMITAGLVVYGLKVYKKFKTL